MEELKSWMPGTQLGPKAPDAKPAFAHIDVMEEYNGIVGQQRQPGLVVVPDCFVGMQTVDVEEVDALASEGCGCFVKCHAEQGGKTPVAFVESGKVGEHFFAVMSGMVVALPGVDGETPRGQAKAIDGLAES